MSLKIAECFERIPHHQGRSQTENFSDPLEKCRDSLSRLFKTGSHKNIVLCKNATEALNIAVLGLNLEGCTVLTTCAEHNSVLRPLNYLEKRGSIEIIKIPCDSEGRPIEKLWLEALKNNKPALAILNHASNVTGAVNCPEKFMAPAKKAGAITLLDISQTAGIIDIDAEKFSADMMAFTGHKYLLGPAGTGGLYVSERIRLEPVYTGGTGVRSDLQYMPDEMPERLEAGTPPCELYEGLLFSLNWQKDNTLDAKGVYEKTEKLSEGLEKAEVDIVRVRGERSCIVSFNIKGWNCLDAGYALSNSFGICCRAGLHCAPLIHNYITESKSGTIRFSLSRFNDSNEIDYAVESVKRLKNAVA